ncbi:MAG TPA: addiction module protein [Polyangium sp.]|nr:addiction module protein [Polyangium sp.]
MSQADVIRILALPVEERLMLLQLLQESLSGNDSDMWPSDAHRKIVEERLAEHEQDPDDVVSLEEALVLAQR